MNWLFAPLPRARLAVFRTIVYSFVFVDVLVTTAWIDRHGALPDAMYHPLFIARWLPVPDPGPLLVPVAQILLLVAAAGALTNRWPRLSGVLVFVLYLYWMLVGFSYGKVDHDRVAFLVALAVIPTAGKARWSDEGSDEAAGWSLRCVQLAVVATYLFAAVAKFRFGGFGWVNGATLMRSVVRRGTILTEPLKDHPVILQITQYGIVAFELLSPLLLAKGRLGRAFVIGALAFHAVTYASITIVFLPHVVCLLSFLPLERLTEFSRTRRSPSVQAVTSPVR